MVTDTSRSGAVHQRSIDSREAQGLPAPAFHSGSLHFPERVIIQREQSLSERSGRTQFDQSVFALGGLGITVAARQVGRRSRVTAGFGDVCGRE